MIQITAEAMQKDYLFALYKMGQITIEKPARPTIRELGENYARSHLIKVADFFGPVRVREVAHPRQDFWATLIPAYSRSEIARAFKRDHTTIMSGIAASKRRARALQ